MKLEFYHPEKHNDQIIKWYKQWNMTVDISVLPTTGIVMDDVCAAFLYETNSSICFIESLISNKEIDKKIVNECLDAVVDAVIDIARGKGFKHIMSYSKYDAVSERAKLHGFAVSDNKYFCFVKEL